MDKPFQSGDVIQDKYIISDQIGEGGMSFVYKATDKTNDIPVAIKFLKPGVTSSLVEDIIRFKREIEAVSKFDHSNIVKLFGAGETETLPFYVMEFLEGNSLEELLQKKVQFNFVTAVACIHQITEALSYVHSRGIIHRDLKPGNVFMQKTPKGYKVKLLDFGLSQVMELGKITEEKEVVGTFGYMSPEATGIVKKPMDERSDLYSLGIIFYELLTGEMPFKAKEARSLLHQQVAMEPEPLKKIKKDIPDILQDMVMKLLYKEGELRYQSAKGLLYDLEQFEKGNLDFIIGEHDQKRKLSYQTKLVGREQEMAKIKGLVEASKEGKGGICLIGGEPGVGKTRLVESVKEYIYEQGYKAGGLFIEGRCVSQANKTPYQPFKNALNEFIRKVEKLEPEYKGQVIDRLKKGLGELGDIIIRLNPNMREILGEVPDLIVLEPEKENQRFIMTVAKFFINLTEEDESGILFLDDLQWADEGSLRLLNEMAKTIVDSRHLIIGTYRANEVNEEHGLMKLKKEADISGYPVDVIALQPLSDERLNRMVAGLLGEREERAKDITKYIQEKSGGNPFFAITILRELVEQKTIVWEGGEWKEDWDKIRSLHISSNIVDLVLSRIKNIPENVDKLLRIGSIIGKEFEMDLLYLLMEGGESNIVGWVDEAIDLQLLEKSITEKGKVIFIHERIREAFFTKIGEDDRRKFHLIVANALVQRYKGKEEEVYFDLAHHYLDGGDKEKALRYLVPSADKAKLNYANEEAIQYYTLTIKIIEEKGGKGDATWLYSKESLADIYLTVGHLNEAITLSEELLPNKKSNLDKARTYKKISAAYFKKGDWKKCGINGIQGLSELGERVPSGMLGVILAILKELTVHLLHSFIPGFFLKKKSKKVKETDKEIIWIYRILDWMYILSDLTRFIWSLLRMLNIAESRIGKSRELANAYSAYGGLCMAMPLFGIALKSHVKSQAMSRELNNEWDLAQGLQMYGYCYQWMGDPKKSMETFEQSRDIMEKIGDVWELGMAEHGWGEACLNHADYEESIQHFDKQREIAQAANDFYGLSGVVGQSARCLFEEGNYVKAREEYEKSIKMSVDYNVTLNICSFNIYFGILETEYGNYIESGKYLQIAKEVSEKNNLIPEYNVFLYDCIADNLIEEYRFNLRKDKSYCDDQKLKAIKKQCSQALGKTKPWPNHYGTSLRISAKYFSLVKQNVNASQYFQKSISQTKSTGRRYELGKSYYEYGNFLSDTGKKEAAEENWNNAYKIFQEIGSKVYLRKCADLLGIEAEARTAPSKDSTQGSKQERLQLERRMTTVLDTSRYLSSILSLDELLDKIMDRAIELVGAERGILFLYPDKDEKKVMELEKKVVKVSRSGGSGSSGKSVIYSIDNITVSSSILAKVTETKKPLIIDDASIHENLKSRASVISSKLKSVICSPILAKGELIGVIYLDSSLVSGLFTEEDLTILELISGQAGVSIENARLYQKSIAKERIEQDLNVASQIQKMFLPRKLEEIKGLSIDARYIPAEFVGGDYYNILKINDKKYAIILADISGHGSSAAIVMSVISFIFTSIADKVKDSADLMEKLSAQLYERLEGEKYATGICLIYDAQSGEFEYTNAGHSDILLYQARNNQVINLEVRGIPIGIGMGPKYEQGKFILEPGDVMMIQTDGIYETMNEQRKQFGFDRVKGMLGNLKDLIPGEINQQILSEAERFRGNQSQEDDITLITIKKS